MSMACLQNESDVQRKLCGNDVREA